MRNNVSLFALSIGLMVASPATAQDAGSAKPAVDGGQSSGPSLQPSLEDTDDIIVTAQRRTERALDVPISIAVIDGNTSRSLGAQTTRDISQIVPGIIMPSRGVALQPAIRGIQSTGTSAGDDPNVATYIDDMYIASSYESVGDLADVERIEVLKGPQGTLFGRNATGGAIKIITRQPQFTPELNFTASYGFEFDELRLSGFATGPLTKSIAMSVATNYVSDGGYTFNIQSQSRPTAKETLNVRTRLLFDLGSDFSVVVSANYSRGNDAAVFALVPFEGNNSNYTNANLPKPKEPDEYAGVDPVLRYKVFGAQINADFRIGSVDFKSITGYRESRVADGFDSDRTILAQNSGFAQIRPRQFSQEIDFATPAERPLSVTGGVYYFYADTDYTNYNFSGDYYYSHGNTPTPVGTAVSVIASNVKTESYAGFAEATFRVDDKLKLIGGIRYTTERKVFNFIDLVRAAGIRTIVDASKRWNSMTYRAVAQYDFTDDLNVYASFNTGFKSGVFASITYPLNLVDPEKIKAFELGMKAKVKGFNITAAAFHYNYDNIQVQARDIVNNVLLVQIFNAANSVVQGLDFSVNGRIAKGLTINTGFSWLPKAEYSSFPNAQVTVPTANNIGNVTIVPFDASGSRMYSSPKFTANFGAVLEQPLGDGAIVLTGNIAYNSGFNFQIADIGHQKAYTIVNASIGWRVPGDRVTLSVFAENLTDERFGIYRAFGSIGTSQAYSRPRLMGLRIQTNFK